MHAAVIHSLNVPLVVKTRFRSGGEFHLEEGNIFVGIIRSVKAGTGT